MAVFRKKVFKNGLTVILVPMKGSITATALVLVRAGSKYETKDINGISHFLEHLCFKGTVKRPRAIDIAKELDEIGAGYNAFTSQEYTGYLQSLIRGTLIAYLMLSLISMLVRFLALKK